MTEKLIHTQYTCPVSIIRRKFNVHESNKRMLTCYMQHGYASLPEHVNTCVHCAHRIKATHDKMTFKDRKMSVVVRYRRDTRQIWQATEFKSEDKCRQITVDRPTSKERMHAAHRLVTSATITYNCMSQSPHYTVMIAQRSVCGVHWHQQTASQYSQGPRRQSRLCGH